MFGRKLSADEEWERWDLRSILFMAFLLVIFAGLFYLRYFLWKQGGGMGPAKSNGREVLIGLAISVVLAGFFAHCIAYGGVRGKRAKVKD